MKNNFTKLVAILFFLSWVMDADAQKLFFKDVSEISFKDINKKRVIKPLKYRTISLDTLSLLNFLKTVPSENTALKNRTSTANIIDIPLPDGSSAKFSIWEASIMEPELAANFPNIKTYTGQGIDDPTATIKIDYTELGFHAMILSPVTTSIFIDNYAQGTKTHYISYYKKDFIKTDKFVEHIIRNIDPGKLAARPEQILAKQCIGTQLRTYRLAVACTGEYAVKATGLSSPTVAQTLSAIVTTVNRVDGVYEKEIDIRMILVATENNVVFTNAATDPFLGNFDGEVLIDESQRVLDSAIGNANYDMGHTFSTGGGGISDLGVICRTGRKGSSITGLPNPVGDPYDIDYVSHEMGHALGADHPFNSTQGSCGGNGSSTTNAEPGSGSTIMAYAGICGSDDLQPHSDPYFHAVSFDQIATYTITGFGRNCGVTASTGNTPPAANAGANYIIPVSTPFILSGSATDADGDALTYCWEQTNVGGPFGAWNNPSGNAPLFRSFPPVTVTERYFPKLSDVINNTTTIGEIMGATARTLNFRLTARDNRAAGGGVCSDTTTVTLANAAAGAFAITYPTATNITWDGGSDTTITWNTANSQLSPINCANVTIQLSLDGGLTYPTTLLASTPNDGSQKITVPNIDALQARIRVMAVGNIFYDISNNNFKIKAIVPTFFFSVPDTVSVCSAATNAVARLATSFNLNYNTPITLSITDNPSGTTVNFNNNPVTPGDSIIVTLNNTGVLSPGIYPVTLSGVSGSITKSQVIYFSVGLTSTTLLTPADLSTGQTTTPTFTWNVAPAADYYTLDISISNTFASIVQSITNITNNSYTLTTPLTQNTVYYWRVSVTNGCGTSAYSPQFLFKTGTGGCSTFVKTASISFNPANATNVTSLLTIPSGSSVTIGDVNVLSITGMHSNISELTFTLSKGSISDTLVNRICNSGQYQDFSFNIDDQSATSTLPCPPTGNVTAAPLQPLSVFNGQTSAGTWTLRIKDNVAVGNGGTFTGWSLQICSVAATPLDLTYTFNGNGNWDIPSNWLNSSVPPATMIAGSSIIIDPIPDGECLLNIPYTVASGSTLTVMPNKIFRIPENFTIHQN